MGKDQKKTEVILHLLLNTVKPCYLRLERAGTSKTVNACWQKYENVFWCVSPLGASLGVADC